MIEAELLDKMTTWRRALHAHPETAFEEVTTARLVASVLREFGFDVTEGVGKTGVVGTLRRGSGPASRQCSTVARLRARRRPCG